MKTREEIITSMCYTMRHDYGLDKHPDDAAFVTGLTGSQRKALWNQMAQLFDNDIAPNMEFKKTKGQAHSCDIAGCAICDPTYGL